MPKRKCKSDGPFSSKWMTVYFNGWFPLFTLSDCISTEKDIRWIVSALNAAYRRERKRVKK